MKVQKIWSIQFSGSSLYPGKMGGEVGGSAAYFPPTPMQSPYGSHGKQTLKFQNSANCHKLQFCIPNIFAKG